MSEGNILVVDDNKKVIQALELFLCDEFDNVKFISKPDALSALLRTSSFDVVLLDMNFTAGINTGNEGLFWLNEIKKINSQIEVVMFTAYGDVELAVKALKKGACDFILKPWDNEKLVATLKSACKLSKSNQKVRELVIKQDSLKKELNKEQTLLLGTSKSMLKVKQMIDKVAKTDANILLTGENGTGKEIIAREIHRLSSRHEGILVTVDMSSIPETLIESELFGHKKGAFTDAKEDRNGKFQLAHYGTLFLDEIGNIPFHLQSKLLVALQTRKITPVGSDKIADVNIRLISATNSDIRELVESKKFREDLLYRINTIHIEIPPLRERPEDIELLANHFMNRYAHKYMKTGIRLGSQALKKLQKHFWPGNVRELEHTMEKAVILSETNILSPESFFFNSTPNYRLNGPATLEEMERQMINDVMEKHQGNYSNVAKQLGITRQTLYNKIKKHDL